MELQNIKQITTWNEATESINSNNLRISTEITKLKNSTYKNKGYFASAEALASTYPTSSVGSKAYVGTSYPYAIYLWQNGAWVDSGETGGEETVTLGDYYTKEEVSSYVEESLEPYSTKEEVDEAIENKYEVLSQKKYDDLESTEDKLYFCYEEE